MCRVAFFWSILGQGLPIVHVHGLDIARMLQAYIQLKSILHLNKLSGF